MHLSQRHYLFLGMCVVLVSTAVWYFSRNTLDTPAELKAKTFSRLEAVMRTKQHQALRYLDRQKQLAMSLSSNKRLVDYFQDMELLYKDDKAHGRMFDTVERNIQELFVNQLNEFYDLLFVNASGDIIFTVKKEDDYQKNVADAKFEGLALQKAVAVRKFSFVDYEYYAVSREPASFYVVPLYRDNSFIGHFVLQLSINQINNIFVRREGLGKTGEVYLVNENQLMITDSRFINRSTVLKQQVNTRAIELAKQGKSGQAIIRDYRDKWVFSRFTEFHFEGVHWYILAEIDEDEVLTDYYVRNEKLLFPEVNHYLITLPHKTKPLYRRISYDKLARVDVGEFVRQSVGEGLYTKGVATCTALAVLYPGRFSYLAHITPTDALYIDGWLQRQRLGEMHTDMLAVIMQRILFEDIRPVEMRMLRIVIAAPQTRSFQPALHRLLQRGILLSQIVIHHIPQQYSMNLFIDSTATEVVSQWKAHEAALPTMLSSSTSMNMVDVLKSVIHYS